MDKKVKRSIEVYLNGAKVKGSVDAINAEVRKLNKEIKNLTIGTKEYEEKAMQISHLKGILQAHRKEITQTHKEYLTLGERVAGSLAKFKEIGLGFFGISKGLDGLKSSFERLELSTS